MFSNIAKGITRDGSVCFVLALQISALGSVVDLREKLIRKTRILERHAEDPGSPELSGWKSRRQCTFARWIGQDKSRAARLNASLAPHVGPRNKKHVLGLGESTSHCGLGCFQMGPENWGSSGREGEGRESKSSTAFGGPSFHCPFGHAPFLAEKHGPRSSDSS